MSKLKLLKLFFTNIQVREMANLLWSIFYNFATKKYLMESTLTDDLETTFLKVDASTRPLSDYTVQTLEKLAFTPLPNRSEISKNMPIKENVYYLETKQEEMQNE